MGRRSVLTPRQTARRRRILKTVRDQLSRFGYDGVSMREVAEDAGVSPTTLYNLFRTKDQLILAALEELIDELSDRVRAAQVSGLDALVVRAEVVAAQIVRTPLYADAMARLLFSAQPTDPISRLLLGDAIAGYRDLLAEMQGLGQIEADADRDMLAQALVADGWATLFLWMKGFIALQELEAQYVRRHLLPLLPAMTPRCRRKYAHLIRAERVRAISSRPAGSRR